MIFFEVVGMLFVVAIFALGIKVWLDSYKKRDRG